MIRGNVIEVGRHETTRGKNGPVTVQDLVVSRKGDLKPVRVTIYGRKALSTSLKGTPVQVEGEEEKAGKLYLGEKGRIRLLNGSRQTPEAKPGAGKPSPEARKAAADVKRPTWEDRFAELTGDFRSCLSDAEKALGDLQVSKGSKSRVATTLFIHKQQNKANGKNALPIMTRCLDFAKQIAGEAGLADEDLVSVANTLFIQTKFAGL